MHTVPISNPTPVMRAAITALDAFGAMDRITAHTLLRLWVRRTQLSRSELIAVLSHYPVGGDPAGYGYSREPDDVPPGGPVPPGVEGGPLGRSTQR